MFEKAKCFLPLVKGGLMEKNIPDLLFLQADGVLSIAHFITDDGTQRMYVDLPLCQLESALGNYNFYRSHKTCLVNVAKVLPYGEYPDVLLELEGGIVVPLSRRKKLEFHNVYLEYRKTLQFKEK